MGKLKRATCHDCHVPLRRHDTSRIEIRLPLPGRRTRPRVVFHPDCLERWREGLRR